MIKEKREKIYKEIDKMRKQGYSNAEIAKMFDMTRQGVWDIFMRIDGKRKPKSVKNLTK